jgi:hypothetical protein
MLSRYFCLALLLVSSVSFSKGVEFKAAWQIANDNPAEYQEILQSSPTPSAIANDDLTWME